MTVTVNAPWLVLWDIDHTLLETRGLGAELYKRAFETATGTRMRQQADVTGQTETSILKATLRLHNIGEDEPYLSRYKIALAKEYQQHREELHGRGRALPGAHDVLRTLSEDRKFVQTILSGNLRAVSETKLNIFGLDQYVDLDVGAYGDDDETRANLVAVAQQKASQKYGTIFSRTNSVVIGDSTHDIETGLRGGAYSIGVASGADSVTILREAGADVVIPDLHNTNAVREAVKGLGR